jgi:hypothetical protein
MAAKKNQKRKVAEEFPSRSQQKRYFHQKQAYLVEAERSRVEKKLLEKLETLTDDIELKRKRKSEPQAKVPWGDKKETESVYLLNLLSEKGFLSERFRDKEFCHKYLNDFIMSEESHRPGLHKERWHGTPGQLVYLIELLLKKKFLPEAYRHKKHVNTAKCFLNKDGNEFGNIDLARAKDKYEGNRKLQSKPQQAGVIEEIVEKLTEYQTSQI